MRIKDKYDVHHGLHIRDSALIAAATLSDRYISDRFLPDKAVDLMDEAAAKIRIEMNSAPAEIDDAKRKLLQLEIESEALKKEKDKRSKGRLNEVKTEIDTLKKKLAELTNIWDNEKAVVSEIQSLKEKLDGLNTQAETSQREGDYQSAARIQYDEIPKLEKILAEKNSILEDSKFLKLEVGVEDIADIVSKWTGIPVTKMLSGEKEKLLHLEDELQNRVVGQDEAVQSVADVIRMSKLGVTDQSRPLGSFLFMGNTGVGKTELGKTLAEVLFDDENAIVRIDMSEYMEQHSVSKLIGSPPGYIGYDEGGQLTEKIRRRPYSVLLFDEIEKAHPNVLNILLQILDDGRLTDTKGRTVNFKNTIIIMTSNMARSDVKKYLRPEFINRIDEIVTFDDLNEQVIREIVDIQLNKVFERLAEQNITLEVDQNVKDYLVKNGYVPEYGARPINRIIKREILAGLSKYILEHPEENKLKAVIDGGKIVIK